MVATPSNLALHTSSIRESHLLPDEESNEVQERDCDSNA